MEILNALLGAGLKAIIYGILGFTGIIIGKKLHQRKEKKDTMQKE